MHDTILARMRPKTAPSTENLEHCRSILQNPAHLIGAVHITWNRSISKFAAHLHFIHTFVYFRANFAIIVRITWTAENGIERTVQIPLSQIHILSCLHKPISLLYTLLITIWLCIGATWSWATITNILSEASLSTGANVFVD